MKVRVTKTQKGGSRSVSAQDLIRVVCRKNVNDAAKVWRTLTPAIMAELAPHLGEFKFNSGRGSRMQPVLTLEGCFKLTMMLPGKRATLFRLRSADVLVGTLVVSMKKARRLCGLESARTCASG